MKFFFDLALEEGFEPGGVYSNETSDSDSEGSGGSAKKRSDKNSPQISRPQIVPPLPLFPLSFYLMTVFSKYQTLRKPNTLRNPKRDPKRPKETFRDPKRDPKRP